MDCLSACFTHAQTCDVTRVQSACKINGQKKLAGTQVLDRTWMWLKKFIPHSIKNRGNSVLNSRLWDYVYQFVYRHNKDLWETVWRSKTTFCVVVHISRTPYRNRKTSYCLVNHMILDYANVWRHRASRRRVTLFLVFQLQGGINPHHHRLGGGFKYVLCSYPYLGKMNSIWHIFFRWIETSNQVMFKKNGIIFHWIRDPYHGFL